MLLLMMICRQEFGHSIIVCYVCIFAGSVIPIDNEFIETCDEEIARDGEKWIVFLQRY
jgi:hypothetical protein